MKPVRTMLVLGVLLTSLAVPGPVAAAGSSAYDDVTGDAVYPGVDVQRVALTHSDDGFLAIGVRTNLLIAGNRLAVHVDADLNGGTGWLGADYAFFYEQYGTGQALLMGVWNGTAWQIVSPATLTYEPGPFGVALVVHGSEIGSPSRGIDVFARGGHADVVGAGDSYSDWAPSSGAYRLDFGTAIGGADGPGPGGTDGPAPAGPGDPQDVAAPALALTLAETRAAARRRMRRGAGSGATVELRRCRRLGRARVRCAARARRGAVVWTGRATVRERLVRGRVRRSVSFRGKRVDHACRRRSSGTAVRARCARRVRW